MPDPDISGTRTPKVTAKSFGQLWSIWIKSTTPFLFLIMEVWPPTLMRKKQTCWTSSFPFVSIQHSHLFLQVMFPLQVPVVFPALTIYCALMRKFTVCYLLWIFQKHLGQMVCQLGCLRWLQNLLHPLYVSFSIFRSKLAEFHKDGSNLLLCLFQKLLLHVHLITIGRSLYSVC